MPRTPWADWADDLGWMEKMQGVRWKRALAAEKHYYTQIKNLPAVRTTAGRFRQTLGRIADEQTQIRTASKPPAYIPSAIADADDDFDVAPCGTAALFAKEYGSQYLTLGFWAAGRGPKATATASPVWKRDGVGSAVAVLGDYCYYTTVDANNRDSAIERCNLLTGAEREVIYRESDPRKIIHLLKAPSKSLFFTIEESGKYDLYFIQYGKATLLDADSTFQTPVGCAPGAAPAWISMKDGKQKLHNCTWPLPHDNYTVVAGSLGRPGVEGSGWLIGNYNGRQRLYKWSAHGARVFYELDGRFEVIVKSVWAGDEEPAIFALSPLAAPRRIHVEADGSPPPAPNAAKTIRGTARSADGTSVEFLIVHKESRLPRLPQQKPTGLLVYGYGSYGIDTTVDRARSLYQPLLDEGWAVAFAFIRGGGDRDDCWERGGRLYNRQRSIEDFEAVIRIARGRLGVPAERTVIAGRSAGGMLVGSAIARNRDGALFGGVFAEVPFVDVLQSMSNKAYPMTTPEQNEFGDPARSLTDFMIGLEHSPVDRVAGVGAPNIFVLARTAENDSQVLAYEPLKWIWRLREGGVAREGKLFAFGEGQGHFYAADADKNARSSDLAIIHTWATSQEVRQKISAYNIKMAGPTRSNRSNRNRQRTTRNRQGGGNKQRTTTRQRNNRQRNNRQRTTRQRSNRH
jgi:hypothetical protein